MEMTSEQNRMIEALYLEMFDKMMAYARCSLSNESLAEEAVQETFRIACQKPDQLCQSINPRGWLVQTLKYTICNIQSSQATAKRILEKFNFNFKLIGTKYLLEAIVYSYFTRETYLFENLEKQIYPYVSQKYNVNPLTIKWAIIRSINTMKTKSNPVCLQSLSIDDSEKITSKFIISEIVNKL